MGWLLELFFAIPIALANAMTSDEEKAAEEERKRTEGSGPYC